VRGTRHETNARALVGRATRGRVPTRRKQCVSDRRGVMHIVIRVRPKKKTSTPLQVEAEVCAFWPYGGRTSDGLVMSDARVRDCLSIFREVTASTNSYSRSDAQHKGVDFRQRGRRGSGLPPAALPCPPYAPCSWTASVGCRTDSEGVSHLTDARPDEWSIPPAQSPSSDFRVPYVICGHGSYAVGAAVL
jgi:hypothetical protein